MDFGLSEEQRLLEASLHRWLDDEVPVARVRQMAEAKERDVLPIWRGLAELGVPGILVPEEYGGSGLGLLDAAVAADSLGSRVTPAPFLGSAVMAPVALLAAGTAEQRASWLPRIATGECRVGVAVTEVDSRRDGAGVAERGGRLHGEALMVLDAGEADAFLVAVTAGEGEDRLALVPAAAAGLELEALHTIDRTRSFGALRFEGVEPADWVGEAVTARRAISRMLDAGRVILAADTLGACDRAIAMAVAYAKERVQFARPVGSFQAVKHLCAEMFAELELARSLVWYAAHAFTEVPEEASLMAAHAKAHMAEIGPWIVRTATEVHGGIGFTDEQNLHFWFKRVGVNRQILGSPDSLREHAARLQGWTAA